MELRCDNRLHGAIEDGRLAVRCRSALCGKRVGVVVMHYFDLRTGQCTTKLYKDPGVKEETNGLGRVAAVRHA